MPGLPSRTTFPHHSVSTNTRTLQVLVEDPSIQDSIKPRTKAPPTLSMRCHINELLFIYYYYYYYSIEVPNSFILPLHFNAFRWDRPTRGGGVIIIIRNNISFRSVTVSVEFKHIELVCINVLLLNETCRFIMYYRSCGFSPDALQYATDSIACLMELCNIKYRLVLLGDFNLPDIDWKCHNLPNNKIYSLFMDFFNEFGLHQFVTRQNHILDLIFSNYKLHISAMEDVGLLASSDHTTIRFSLNCKEIRSDNPITHFRNYRRGNFELVNNYFYMQDWIFQRCFSVNECWNMFKKYDQTLRPNKNCPTNF